MKEIDMGTINHANQIIKKLKSEGHEAYLVGGAVRDHLLGLKPQDFDLTTSAKPNQVMKLFESRATGFKYGTITVLIPPHEYEVTTYRTDGPSEDQRHPDYVFFGESVTEDVLRRDFTINGLLMDEHGDVFDYVNGKDDLERKQIQTIGDPYLRFSEDALRILRAIYFQGKLKFSIEHHTQEAMKKMAGLIHTLSNERIINELIKIIKSDHQLQAFETIQALNIHTHIKGIKETVELVVKKKKSITPDTFFTVAYAFDDKDMSEWTFSNKLKHKYQTAAQLSKEMKPLNAQHLFDHGLEIVKLAARTQAYMFDTSYAMNKLEYMYEHLPIKSVVELKMKASEMMALVHKKAGAWIQVAQEDMVRKILSHELKNERAELFIYFRTTYLKGKNDE
jgi:tRNA nucleotidyltransferase (CCA-adding enzyme)